MNGFLVVSILSLFVPQVPLSTQITCLAHFIAHQGKIVISMALKSNTFSIKYNIKAICTIPVLKFGASQLVKMHTQVKPVMTHLDVPYLKIREHE